MQPFGRWKTLSDSIYTFWLPPKWLAWFFRNSLQLFSATSCRVQIPIVSFSTPQVPICRRLPDPFVEFSAWGLAPLVLSKWQKALEAIKQHQVFRNIRSSTWKRTSTICLFQTLVIPVKFVFRRSSTKKPRKSLFSSMLRCSSTQILEYGRTNLQVIEMWLKNHPNSA